MASLVDPLMCVHEYTAVIRTDRCGQLLAKVVSHLRMQSCPPREIVFVDSSGDDDCRSQLMKLGDIVVKYPKEPFNFSRALNIGIEASKSANILIISSHVVLAEPRMIEQGFAVLVNENADVVYWIDSLAAAARVDKINRYTFDGRNGLSNACAMLPRRLWTERSFREDVFSAEDNEWAAWLFRVKNGSSVRIKHPDLLYANPNVNIQKTINEEIAIAYFVFRRDLLPDRIIGRVCRSLLACVRLRPERARMHWEIAKGLVSANFRRPIRKSRYF